MISKNHMEQECAVFTIFKRFQKIIVLLCLFRRKTLQRNIHVQCYLEEHLILPGGGCSGSPNTTLRRFLQNWERIMMVPKALPGKRISNWFPQVILLVGELMLLLKPDVPGLEWGWVSDDSGVFTVLLSYLQQVLSLVWYKFPKEKETLFYCISLVGLFTARKVLSLKSQQ